MSSILTFRTIVALLAISAQPLSSQSAPSPDSASPAKSVGTVDKAGVRQRLLSSIPPLLYDKWKKYGQWDYKQRGSQYRDFTQFNFGATAGKAGVDKEALVALARAFRPDPKDLDGLDDPDLEDTYVRNADEFEKVRKMAEQDFHLIRIAADYTWLDSNNSWPREDVGFTEERWNDYRSFFKKLSVRDGIVRTDDFPEAIFLIFRAQGLCTGGSSSGYVYSIAPLTPIVKTPKEALDAEARKSPGKHNAYVFKRLKDNWYAFYQVDW